jgi:hypothetical protein
MRPPSQREAPEGEAASARAACSTGRGPEAERRHPPRRARDGGREARRAGSEAHLPRVLEHVLARRRCWQDVDRLRLCWASLPEACLSARDALVPMRRVHRHGGAARAGGREGPVQRELRRPPRDHEVRRQSCTVQPREGVRAPRHSHLAEHDQLPLSSGWQRARSARRAPLRTHSRQRRRPGRRDQHQASARHEASLHLGLPRRRPHRLPLRGRPKRRDATNNSLGLARLHRRRRVHRVQQAPRARRARARRMPRSRQKEDLRGRREVHRARSHRRDLRARAPSEDLGNHGHECPRRAAAHGAPLTSPDS